jgi:hypothetical protein
MCGEMPRNDAFDVELFVHESNPPRGSMLVRRRALSSSRLLDPFGKFTQDDLKYNIRFRTEKLSEQGPP